VTFLFDMDDNTNFDTDMQKFAKFFIKHDTEMNRYQKPDSKSHNVWF